MPNVRALRPETTDKSDGISAEMCHLALEIAAKLPSDRIAALSVLELARQIVTEFLPT